MRSLQPAPERTMSALSSNHATTLLMATTWDRSTMPGTGPVPNAHSNVTVADGRNAQSHAATDPPLLVLARSA
nr:hypothetical protein [Streptomyces spinoverrucosus]